jgi:hypothetical protein
LVLWLGGKIKVFVNMEAWPGKKSEAGASTPLGNLEAGRQKLEAGAQIPRARFERSGLVPCQAHLPKVIERSRDADGLYLF